MAKIGRPKKEKKVCRSIYLTLNTDEIVNQRCFVVKRDRSAEIERLILKALKYEQEEDLKTIQAAEGKMT